jgi:predicted transcriptional regulator
MKRPKLTSPFTIAAIGFVGTGAFVLCSGGGIVPSALFGLMSAAGGGASQGYINKLTSTRKQLKTDIDRWEKKIQKFDDRADMLSKNHNPTYDM